MLITCVKSNDTTNTVEDLKFTGILQNDLNCYIAPSGFLVPKYPINDCFYADYCNLYYTPMLQILCGEAQLVISKLNYTFKKIWSGDNETYGQSRLDHMFHVKPQSVNITKGRKPLATKKTNELVCRSTGSIPPAKITWWKGSKKLKSKKYYVSADKLTSTSILTFRPTPKDNGAYLSCRAENPAIDGSAMEDGMKIEVHFAPQVTLNIQSGLDGSVVEEGSDVFFSCSMHAEPAVEKIEWMYNGKPLEQNQSDNIIISNESLHLQRVQRSKNGDYSCMGRNREGKGISNTVTLRVKYAPICKEGQIKAYGISKHEPAEVKCEVDADPQFVDFKWKFNNSKEEFGIVAFKSKGLTSIATYTPRTDEDYGFLFCMATNSVGEQKVPCVYTLVFAAPPEPVENCTVVNQTVEMVHVVCDAGNNCGLPASLLHGGEANHPLFVFNPIILILIGVVASLVIIAVIIVIAMKLGVMRKRRRKPYVDQIKTHIPFQTTIIDQDFQQYEMKDPDIIPARNSVNDSGYEDFGEDQGRKKKNNEMPYEGVPDKAKLLSQNNSHVATPKSKKQLEEVAYAELSLPPNNKSSKDTIRRQEKPTEYATIDFQRKTNPRSGNSSLTHQEDSDASVDTPLMNNKLESTIKSSVLWKNKKLTSKQVSDIKGAMFVENDAYSTPLSISAILKLVRHNQHTYMRPQY
ncbi:Cell adhesion molecule 2 [Nymphon striatum]|nr:Cell adhesion molecule 2 [Nymphon striatum]